ncbi:MAG: type II toxin-antitoxin system HicB family antitoxin [Tepidiformaceae bacterium]
MRSYTVVLSPNPAGPVTLTCPAMPGLVVEGDDRSEALAVAVGLMRVWLELADERGFAPREETPETIAAEVASVLSDRADAGWPLTVETAQIALDQAVAA